MNDARDPEERTKELFSRLMGGHSDANETLKILGELIDLADASGDEEALKCALTQSDVIEARGLNTEEQFTLLYFRANIWGSFVRLREARGILDRTSWSQVEMGRELLLLRTVVSNEQFNKWAPVRRAQVLTNLGSIFSTLGRVVEAIEYRDRALEAVPRFGMALGTRAETLLAYGKALYQTQDRLLFCAAAIDGFANASAKTARYENDYGETVARWSERHVELDEWLKGHQVEALQDRDLGSGEKARGYCSWCLKNRLFLDPLNDLGPIDAAARDRLHLPAIAPHDARTEMLMGYLDAMQQEFVSARWSLYEALTLGENHFSDAGLAPHDTGDGPRYGLGIERAKTAYRTTYSIFDKIAFFLNAWLTLGIPPDKVSFRNVWLDAKRKSLRQAFASSQNWPLRGLYWLSRDLFEQEYKDHLEPDAQALADVRNHLEHKYLRVVRNDASAAEMLIAADPLVYVVKETTFEKQALRILKLARASLIYLVLAVHNDERRKGSSSPLGPKTRLPRL